MKPEEVLELPMGNDSTSADTIKEYLILLLATLWDVGESFSGKKPFGDSGWEYELYEALANAGLIDAVRDEDGYFESVDDVKAHRIIAEAIDGLRD